MTEAATSDYVRYETTAEGKIALVTLTRGKYHNAQNRGLLVALDEAFMQAERDDAVRVIILRGEGKSFSAGHDLGTADQMREKTPGPDQHWTYQCYGGTHSGTEARTRQEWHFFFEYTKRWRDLRKITIAQVHGKVLSAGLMLAWACDLIVADEETLFADVVATRLGMCGVEYFAHPWELGPRRAKELLLTGDGLDATDAHRIGMVAKVFAQDELSQRTLEFAARIAAVPTFAALLVKDSVNGAQEAMGFSAALNVAFANHQLNHAYWSEATNGEVYYGTVEHGLEDWRSAPAIRPARVDQA